MRFTYYHFTTKPSPIRVTELLVSRESPELYHFPEDLKYGNKELIITVDPGTTAVGITVGDFEKPSFYTIITIKRSNNAYESNADQFSNAFNNRFLKDFLRYNNVKRIVIESQYLDPTRGSHTFKVLSGFVRGIRSVISSYGLKPEEIAPPTWKSTFLQGYEFRDQIDLRKSNKEHIVNRARDLIPRLYQFPNGDGYDSFGMMYHYYKTMHRPKEGNRIIKVMTSMTKDYRSKLFLTMGIVDVTMSQEEVFTIAKNHEKHFSGQRSLFMFEPHDKMSAEENIRALMNENPHIYLGFTKPYARLFPELLNQRDNIGTPLEEDGLIYIMGYRSRIR